MRLPETLFSGLTAYPGREIFSVSTLVGLTIPSIGNAARTVSPM
jgi:hypothetical protein